jgi:hypothetical protein
MSKTDHGNILIHDIDSLSYTIYSYIDLYYLRGEVKCTCNILTSKPQVNVPHIMRYKINDKYFITCVGNSKSRRSANSSRDRNVDILLSSNITGSLALE